MKCVSEVRVLLEFEQGPRLRRKHFRPDIICSVLWGGVSRLVWGLDSVAQLCTTVTQMDKKRNPFAGAKGTNMFYGEVQKVLRICNRASEAEGWEGGVKALLSEKRYGRRALRYPCGILFCINWKGTC